MKHSIAVPFQSFLDSLIAVVGRLEMLHVSERQVAEPNVIDVPRTWTQGRDIDTELETDRLKWQIFSFIPQFNPHGPRPFHQLTWRAYAIHVHATTQTGQKRLACYFSWILDWVLISNRNIFGICKDVVSVSTSRLGESVKVSIIYLNVLFTSLGYTVKFNYW